MQRGFEKQFIAYSGSVKGKLMTHGSKYLKGTHSLTKASMVYLL